MATWKLKGLMVSSVKIENKDARYLSQQTTGPTKLRNTQRVLPLHSCRTACVYLRSHLNLTAIMENNEEEEVTLEFAIIQLMGRTDPSVASWASANDFEVIEGMYFITDKLPTG